MRHRCNSMRQLPPICINMRIGMDAISVILWYVAQKNEHSYHISPTTYQIKYTMTNIPQPSTVAQTDITPTAANATLGTAAEQNITDVTPSTLQQSEQNIPLCKQDQIETPIEQGSREEQAIDTAQTQKQNKAPCYFIGDDDQQISDSQEQQQIVQSEEQYSSSQQAQQHKQQQQSQQQQMQQTIGQQQSDQDLQNDDEQSQQADSDDQQQSEDEYPSDYDSQQQQLTHFDNIVKLAHHRPSQQQTQQQFLERYNKVKQALQAEQLGIKQQQALFSNFPPSCELQIKKLRVSQGLLSLINNNYVRRLKINQSLRKRNQLKQEKQCISMRQGENNCSQLTQNNRVRQRKAIKKVVFSQSIQTKVFKVDEEVEIIQQTAQLSQMLNTLQKGDKRLVTFTLRNLNFNPILPNRPRLHSQQNITEQHNNHSALPKQEYPPNPTIMIQTNCSTVQQDRKSNDTSSSEQRASKQQQQFQQIAAQQPGQLCCVWCAKQMMQRKQGEDSVYFCSGCSESAVVKS